MTDDSIPLCTSLVIFSILFNMVITLAITAFNAVSRSKVRNRLKEDPDDSRYKRLSKLLERPSRYRFTDHLLRILGFGTGFCAVMLIPQDRYQTRIIAGIIYVCLMTIFADIIPTKIAKSHCDALSLRMAGFQRVLCIILSPVIFIAEGIADIFLKLFRQNTDIDRFEFSEDDVISMLEAGEKSGELKKQSKRLIGSIFRFDDEHADEIMTPRTDVFMIDINDPKDEYFDELMSLKYSRIPVYEDEYDNIIGILNIKDYLIKAREEGFEKVDIKPILRDPMFVPETKNIDSLFFEMQKEKQHIAILIDEYGGFSGIVTMEDIIEEIVGDIDDEYDDEEEPIDKIGDNVYLIDGGVSLADLNEQTGSDLESQSSETIGGFIIDQIGEIPEDGYVNLDLEYENYKFTIISVSDRRVKRLKMTILDSGENNERN